MAAAQFVDLAAQDLRPGRVQLRDRPLQVRAEQAFAHALDDVFILGLQARHLPALIAQLAAGFAQTFRQIAGKVSHREKSEKARANFHLQRCHQIRRQAWQLVARNCSAGNFSTSSGYMPGKIDELDHRPHEHETDGRHQKRPPPGKENAGQDNRHQIERKIVALQVARHMDDGGDDDDVGEDLEVRLQQIITAELIVNQEEQAEDEPENDRHPQITDGSNVGRIGAADGWHNRWQRQK